MIMSFYIFTIYLSGVRMLSLLIVMQVMTVIMIMMFFYLSMQISCWGDDDDFSSDVI